MSDASASAPAAAAGSELVETPAPASSHDQSTDSGQATVAADAALGDRSQQGAPYTPAPASPVEPDRLHSQGDASVAKLAADGVAPPPSPGPESVFGQDPEIERIFDPAEQEILQGGGHEAIYLPAPEIDDEDDPTEALWPSIEKACFANLTGAAARRAVELLSHGTLFVVCDAPDIAWRASVEIALDERFANRHRRVWELDAWPGTLLPGVRRGRLRSYGERNDLGELPKHGAVIIVRIRAPGAMSELLHVAGPLFDNPVWQRDPVSLIFCLSGSLLDHPDYREFVDRQRVWRIDGIEELLRDAGVDEPELARFASQLHSSCSSGVWGADRERALRAIERILREGGAAALGEDLAKRAGRAGRTPEQRAQEILATANAAELTAIFLATYFQALDVHRFADLLSRLTADETVEMKESQTVRRDDGTMEQRDTRRHVPAAAYWSQHEQAAMARLGLRYRVAGRAGLCIGFADEALPEAMRSVLPAAYRCGRFDALYDLGLLHERDDADGGGDGVVTDLIRLSAEMVALHPRAYGSAWLVEQYLRALQARRPDSAPERVVRAARSRRNDHVVRNFARLCKELPSTRMLGDPVHELLKGVVRAMQPDVAGVLPLLGALRGADGVDPVAICRNLVEVGNVESCREVMSWLVAESGGDPDLQWTTLARVAAWLPSEAQGATTQTSNAHRWAAAFLYMVYERARQERRRAGKKGVGQGNRWLDLGSDPDVARARAALLADTLTHPEFLPALDRVLQQTTPGGFAVLERALPQNTRPAEFCRAEVVHFFHANQLCPARREIDTWVARLSSALPRAERRRLRMLVRLRADIARRRLGGASRDERSLLVEERHSLLELWSILAKTP